MFFKLFSISQASCMKCAGMFDGVEIRKKDGYSRAMENEEDGRGSPMENEKGDDPVLLTCVCPRNIEGCLIPKQPICLSVSVLP